MHYLLILSLFYGSIIGAAAAAAAMPAVERKIKREIAGAASSIPRWQRIAARDNVPLARFLDEKLNVTKDIVFDYLEGDNPEPLWRIIDTSDESIVDLAFSMGPDDVHKRSENRQLYQSYDIATGQELYRYRLPEPAKIHFPFRSKSVLAHLSNGRIILFDQKHNKKKEREFHFKSFMAPRKTGWISRLQDVQTAERILPDRTPLQVMPYADSNELIVDNGEHTFMLDAATLRTKGIFGECAPRNIHDPLERARSCWKIGDDIFLARSDKLHFYKLPENYGAPHRTFNWSGKGRPYQIIKLVGNKFLIESVPHPDKPSVALQVANMNDGSVAFLPAYGERITHIQNDEFLSLSYERIRYWDLNRSWSSLRTFIDAKERHIRGVFVRPDRSFIAVYCGGEIVKFHLDNDTRAVIRPAGGEPEYIREVCMNVNGDLMCRSDREVQCLSLKSDVQLAYEAGKTKINALLAIQAAKDAKKKKPAAAAAARG